MILVMIYPSLVVFNISSFPKVQECDVMDRTPPFESSKSGSELKIHHWPAFLTKLKQNIYLNIEF